MNKWSRKTLRLAQLVTVNSSKFFRNTPGKGHFTRTLWYMSKNPGSSSNSNLLHVQTQSIGCNCGFGCSLRHIHTKGERELVEFLTEEILAERKAQKNKVPSILDGFSVELQGADVELIKQSDKAKVVISFNVNHTVDTEGEAEIDSVTDKPVMGEMRSKPQFEVDIVKANTTLSFTCSFLPGTAHEGEYNDAFGIDEMCIFEGEWNDKAYAVAGDVLDDYLYDLLMNLLEEEGVSNEFVEKLSDLATAHEQTLYIELLEKISKFATVN